MRQRVLLARNTLALFGALVLLLPATAFGQTTDTKATPTFRTPWGDPDLQGIWDTDAMRSVPLERATEFDDRAVLTNEELSERAAVENVRAIDNKVGRPEGRQQPLRTPAHWDEWSDEPSARTSFIVDPPNGRFPPQTLGAQLRVPIKGSQLGLVGGSFADGPFNDFDDFNLASRLSFFLWGSLPDQTLLELATQGTLHEPPVLTEQVERMLRDRRLKRFCDSFPGQWLQLDRLISSIPD